MSGDYEWDSRGRVSFIEDEPEEIMCIDEQAFGYGAGYADATKKAQAKIDTLVEALKAIVEDSTNIGIGKDARRQLVCERALAAIKAATEQS